MQHKKLLPLLCVPCAVMSAAQGIAAEADGDALRWLEEIVVTAQKREQNVQDIGAAVTALGEDRLVDSGVNNVQDLQTMAPGLTLGESFGFAQIMIRGVGTDNPFAGGDPSVAMHVDGAVIGQSSAQLGSLFDVQRIEVLRGPQGTLYGRNTTGGSINVITNKPTEEFGGYSRFTAGNYDLLQFEGAVSGPLSESLRGRLAVKVVDRGGYGENLVDGSDIDDARQDSVRAHLEWFITEDVDLLLSFEHHKEDDTNYMPKFRSASYPESAILALFPDATPAQIGALQPQPTSAVRASDPRDIFSNVDLQNEREQSSVTATLNWNIGENYQLVSVSNYQTFDKLPQQDFDMTATNFYVQSERVESEQYSEELRLHYEGTGINGLVGVFYYSEEVEADNRLHQAIPVPPCAAGGQSNIIDGFDIDTLCFHFRGTAEAEAAAVFANVNIDLGDTLLLNLGARYSYESREGFTDRWFAPGSPILTFEDERSFNDFSPSVRLEWSPNDEILFYAGYTEGFKSGIFLAGQRNEVLDPETMEAFEIGMKGQFFENRVQLNSALFYYDYTDLQQGRSVPAGATGFTLIYENAAAAEIEGLELEAIWLVSDYLRLDASATYLNAEFSDYVTTDPFDTVYFQLGLAAEVPEKQLEGNSMVQSPEWAWTLRGVVDLPAFQNGWEGQVALEAAYKDRIHFSQFNHEALSQESVTTYNANVKFTSPNDSWSVNIWGKNLTDELIYTGMFIINGSRTNAGMLAPPRTYGATVSYNF